MEFVNAFTIILLWLAMVWGPVGIAFVPAMEWGGVLV